VLRRLVHLILTHDSQKRVSKTGVPLLLPRLRQWPASEIDDSHGIAFQFERICNAHRLAVHRTAPTPTGNRSQKGCRRVVITNHCRPHLSRCGDHTPVKIGTPRSCGCLATPITNLFGRWYENRSRPRLPARGCGFRVYRGWRLVSYLTLPVRPNTGLIHGELSSLNLRNQIW